MRAWGRSTKGDRPEDGIQDGGYFSRLLKRKRINNQAHF